MSSSTKRTNWLALVILIALSGCAWERVGPPGGDLAGKNFDSQILLYQEEITHGNRLNFPGIIGALAGAEVRLAKPVAIGGFGNNIYVADGGTRTLYRYNPIGRGFYELKDAGSLMVGDASQIYAAADNSFYVVDPFGNQVIQFDQNGNTIRAYQNFKNVPQPVAVSVDHKTNQVHIADGTHGYVVVFNKIGQALFATGSRGDDQGQFRMITAMTQGPDGMYIADRLRGDVQVLSNEGKYLYSFAKKEITFPTAMVVDKYNRVFVADSHDNTIKVFKKGKMLEKVGGTGVGPGQFRNVTDMWLSDSDLLYVADSLNSRLQVFRVKPESLMKKPSAEKKLKSDKKK